MPWFVGFISEFTDGTEAEVIVRVDQILSMVFDESGVEVETELTRKSDGVYLVKKTSEVATLAKVALRLTRGDTK